MKHLFALAFLVLIAGCSSFPKTPDGFTGKTVETEHFTIAVWEKDIKVGEPLRIYIEGDGSPAPKRPMGLLLAARDPSDNVIYVSRPCQFIKDKICANSQIWKEEMFHEEIIQEMQELIIFLARKYKTPSLELVGYDGGAVVALLLAAKMPVARVITIGGILDTDAYARHHMLPPVGGENPKNYAMKLAKVPQIHYVGAQDKITPRRLAERFVATLPRPRSAIVKVVPDIHHANWDAAVLDYY